MTVKETSVFVVLLFVNFLLFTGSTIAQSKDLLPSFGLTLSSGQTIKTEDLPKGKPVLLIYFAPDCDHCHTLMNAFFKRAGDFKAAEVLLVTFKPVNELHAFEQAYETYRYPNIKVGTETPVYFVRLFYRVQTTPFTALYNKKGALVSIYRKETPLNDLVKQLNAL